MRRTDRLTALACFTSESDATGEHPAGETLRRYLDGALPPRDDAALERHLLACPACEATLIELLPTPPAGGSAGPLPDPHPARRFLDRMGTDLSAALRQRAVERREGEELWRRLERCGSELRRDLVHNSWNYQHRGLFELLLERGQGMANGEPRQREEVLRLALEMAEQLDPAIYGPGSVKAAQARAWGHLGVALTAGGDFAQAEEAFDAAASRLPHSWCDPLDEALLLEQRAGLRRAQHLIAEALALLTEALAILREINETHTEGRVLRLKGQLLEATGDLAEAAACYRSSLSLLDGLRAPELIVSSHLGLVSTLLESGQVGEADPLFPATRQVVEEVGNRGDRLRLLWLEGRAATLLRQAPDTEPALQEAERRAG